MTPIQMQYFAKTCRAGSIAAAAEELFVSRSVLSRSIAKLEQEFETQLLIRTHNGVEITEAGKILLNMISEINGTYIVTRERIRKLDTSAADRLLTIGITPTNGLKVYRLLLSDFKKKYPDIAISVIEHPANQAHNYIIDGTADAFFVPGRTVEYPTFSYIDLYYSRNVLAVKKSDPFAGKSSVAVEELLTRPLGLLGARLPSYIENVLTECSRVFKSELNIVIRTSVQELLRYLIMAGDIIALLPDDMIEGWEGIVGVPVNYIPRTMNRFIWNSAVPHSSALRDMIKFIEEYNQNTHPDE